ncbi:hypothetical protein ACI784_06165 [Geodermatophilus sp. SYSU D01186]
MTVSLDPAEVELSLRPKENVGEHPGFVPYADPETRFVDMAYTGSARLHLPQQVDASAMVASLDLMPAPGAVPTRSYSTGAALPADQLVVTALGDGWYDVVMPADDGVNGPYARLSFAGITPATGVGAGITFIDPLSYQYRFTGTVPGFLQYAVPQLVATAALGCPAGASTPCVTATVVAGSDLSLPVPSGSRLRALGLGDPQSPFVWTSLQTRDAHGGVSAEFEHRTQLGPEGLTVTLPAGLAAGRYHLEVLLGVPSRLPGAGTTNPSELSVTSFDIEVTAAPVTAAPVTPSQNQGLRSETGWVEPAAGTDVSPVVVLGGGMVVAAGLATAAVLRPGRRAAGE